jgi:hypothetical protein
MSRISQSACIRDFCYDLKADLLHAGNWLIASRARVIQRFAAALETEGSERPCEHPLCPDSDQSEESSCSKMRRTRSQLTMLFDSRD